MKMELQVAAPSKRVVSQRKHHWATRRRRATLYPSTIDTPIESGCNLLFAWPADSYPGKLAGLVMLFQNKVASRTISDWRRGRRTMPQWARDILIAELEKKTAAFSAAVSQLKNKNN